MTSTKCMFRFLIVAAVALASGGGCSQYNDPNVPAPIRPIIEPDLGQQYLLYRPSSYDAGLAWPLVVVCHGPFPDSPVKQLRAWTELAESDGFLLIAPTLTTTKKRWSRNEEEYLASLRTDEANILAALHHVRGGHNVSSDRVFLYGWSTGACAALHTGMRHPDVFRALGIVRPKVESDFLADVVTPVNHHQPIYVNFSVADALTGKHSSECADWLRSVGADVRQDGAGSARHTDTERIVQFFEDILRTEPWILIRAFPAGDRNPREMQFRLRSSFVPQQYHWEFGDGDESPVAAPIHVFREPGTYRVTVTVDDANKTKHRRTLDLRIP